MRTTLTLDDDVARLLQDEAHRRRKPFKEVVNDALRRALSPRAGRKPPPYKIQPHRARLQPGVDPAGFNRLLDELETDEALAKLPR